jgi:hypothetical protein
MLVHCAGNQEIVIYIFQVNSNPNILILFYNFIRLEILSSSTSINESTVDFNDQMQTEWPLFEIFKILPIKMPITGVSAYKLNSSS